MSLLQSEKISCYFLLKIFFVTIFFVPMQSYIPTPKNPWNAEKAAHLLRRAVVGVKPSEIERAVQEGYERTITRLFTPYTPPLGFIAEWVGKEPNGNQPPEGPGYEAWLADIVGRRTGFNQWWMKTIVEAPICLHERLLLFWHGHFTTSFSFVQHAEWMWTQHQLLRRHALGNFKQFVKDITVDVAMLWYLNGLENEKTEHSSAINENYARELLEIYTMGITDAKGRANYTQTDVREIARALTGWKMEQGSREGYWGIQSVFHPWRWDSGNKTVFGKTGAWKAMDIVDILFEQRSEQIAYFMCRKLYRWFVVADEQETPESLAIIRDMAKVFINSDWEIAPVIRDLLTSEEFFAQANIGCLPKSGADFFLGLLRTFEVSNISDFEASDTLAGRFNKNDMLLRMEELGHFLCFPPSVAGWNDGRHWLTSSSLAARLKLATRMMLGTMRFRNEWEPRYSVNILAFAKQFADVNNPKRLISALTTALWSVPADENEQAILLEVLMNGAADYEWNIDAEKLRPEERLRRCLAQIVSMPKFQLL